MTRLSEQYRQSLEYTVSQARKLLETHGVKALPDQGKMSRLGFKGLRQGIQYHGGMGKIRALLGETPNNVPRGTWRNIEYGLAQANYFMAEHNFKEFPNLAIVAELRSSSLAYAITNYYGGIRKFRELLGQKTKQKPKGVWKNVDYALSQARDLMKKHNFKELPNSKIIAELGYHSLASSITIYHGGARNFRMLLGEEPKRKPRSTWKNFEYAQLQAREFLESNSLETLPSLDEISELGYPGLSAAITTHYGGIRKFRELLGQKTRHAPSGSWKSIDYALAQAKSLMDRHEFEELPSRKMMVTLGYGSLGSAIVRYHGGPVSFREKLRECMGPTVQTNQLQEFFYQYLAR